MPLPLSIQVPLLFALLSASPSTAPNPVQQPSAAAIQAAVEKCGGQMTDQMAVASDCDERGCVTALCPYGTSWFGCFWCVVSINTDGSVRSVIRTDELNAPGGAAVFLEANRALIALGTRIGSVGRLSLRVDRELGLSDLEYSAPSTAYGAQLFPTDDSSPGAGRLECFTEADVRAASGQVEDPARESQDAGEAHQPSPDEILEACGLPDDGKYEVNFLGDEATVRGTELAEEEQDKDVCLVSIEPDGSLRDLSRVAGLSNPREVLSQDVTGTGSRMICTSTDSGGSVSSTHKDCVDPATGEVLMERDYLAGILSGTFDRGAAFDEVFYDLEKLRPDADWSCAPELIADTPLHLRYSARQWQGPRDVSLRWRAVVRKDQLGFLVEVKDDRVIPLAEASKAVASDHVEIWIKEMRLGVLLGPDGKAEVRMWRDQQQKQVDCGISQGRWMSSGDGYLIEFSIPKDLVSRALSTESSFRPQLKVLASDSDQGRRQEQLIGSWVELSGLQRGEED